MTTVKPLCRGILGCARITRRGLIPGIQGSQGSTLAALGSRDGSTARARAEQFGVPRSYESYQEVIDDPGIDAEYVPLPNELHRPRVRTAADAGKHVLCEKPLALDAAEAGAMVAHCRARGVILMEAFMWRHRRRTEAVRRLVADGAIGAPRPIRSSFSLSIALDDWRIDPARGGGALWDIGSCGVSTARLFTEAEPTTVHALARQAPAGVDQSLTAELTFPGDVFGLIDCSFEQPFRCRYKLVGTTGAIEVPDAYLPPDRPVARLIGSDDAVEERTFDGRNQYASMVDAFALAVDVCKHGGRIRPGRRQRPACRFCRRRSGADDRARRHRSRGPGLIRRTGKHYHQGSEVAKSIEAKSDARRKSRNVPSPWGSGRLDFCGTLVSSAKIRL